MKLKILFCLAVIWMSELQAQKQNRIKENFDFDWKFYLGDDAGFKSVAYNDAKWEQVQLPHDWNIKQDFDPKGKGSAAYLPEGIGWYRKAFTLPTEYKDRQLAILFDGIFNQSDVYINGHHLGFRPYGFASIEYDITPYVQFGKENIIAVRVNCTGERPRWYAGSGIYRHVWLQATNPIHILTYGTFITTQSTDKVKADLKVTTFITNKTGKNETVYAVYNIKDKNGKIVSSAESAKKALASADTLNILQSLVVKSPTLWTLETPEMYTLETIVKSNGKTLDVQSTPFGIRTIKFDKDKGFFLNGKHVKLKGMCLHQDAGCLGVAVPDRSYERRLEIIKEYGCNAIRCAHNQPSPEFLDMCDRMGFLVIDEAFDKWKGSSYKPYFDEWWQRDLANMILRDRNHPSIILWSIGNELGEATAKDNVGIDRATMLKKYVKTLDTTRLVTLAASYNHREEFAGVVDVVGYNYLEASMLSDKKKLPERIVLVSEELPYFRGEEGNLRSYTPLNPWKVVADNDFVAGGFIWSGVDYLGESGWPSKGWPNGLFDVCMFEKPRAAYHRAMWNDKPFVSIGVIDQAQDINNGRDLWQWPRMASSWNFPDSYRGMVMEVRTTTNCESVEMFLNDKSMGRQRTANYTNNTIVWNLPYNPGKLEAVAYNGDAEVTRYKLVTSKSSKNAVVTPDRTTIKADGQDLSHIVIQLIDENGNPVQTDNKKITVELQGEGKFLGIDNGDLRREKSFAGNQLKTYFGKALVIVQSTRKPGKMVVNLTIEGMNKEFSTEISSR